MTFYSVLLFVSFNFYCASGGLFDKKSCSPCRVDVVNLVKTENIQSFDSQTLYVSKALRHFKHIIVLLFAV